VIEAPTFFMLLRRLKSLFRVKGIWAGMIGGTAVQTLILAIITVRCDWEKEVSYLARLSAKLPEHNFPAKCFVLVVCRELTI
jgi:hypothetical protein